MKIAITTFLVFSQIILSSNIQAVKHTKEEAMAFYREGHIIVESLSQKDDLKIGLTFPDISNNIAYYTCTNEVLTEAKNILQNRPNGSEVYVMVVDAVIWELKLCHEHNGQIIKCGKELNE